MSFLGRLKKDAIPSDAPKPAKIVPSAQGPSALDKHLADLAGPSRPDGSDKFFGFENYSSTCYCNSILQALYYSEPFRNNVINFPPTSQANGNASKPGRAVQLHARSPISTRPPPPQPGPLAANSPARRPLILPGTQLAQTTKPDEKDSPEWKKKLLMQSAHMLDMQLDYSDSYGMQESLFSAMKDIFEAIISQDTRTGIVSPHKFLEILRRENDMFRSAMHQDAHEFLNLLLNQVADTVDLYQKQQSLGPGPEPVRENGAVNGMAQPTAVTKAATGWVHELFEGLLVSETRCLTCENVSQRDEAFMDLSVDLTAHSSVTSCLRKFSEEEMLCERNKFHCDGCGGLQEAEKRMKIKRLPRVLALHLKRFEYSEDYSRLQKLFHKVAYPFHLRLFNTTEDAQDQDRLYELYAVVVHIGGGPYHGHYVSIIKTQDRGWLLFDDELVEPVTKSYVQSFFGGELKQGTQDAKQLSCAYVLFYQETTEEAIQKETEAEAAAATAAAAAAIKVSEAASPASPPVNSSNPWTNGLKAMHGLTTPTEERDEPFTNLSHAVTAPAVPSGYASLAPSSTVPNGHAAPLKTKKDLKREEKVASKERKAAEKEAEKAAKEARTQRNRERLDLRNVRAKRQEEEYQQALEASRQTKAEEDMRTAMDPKEGKDGVAETDTTSVLTGTTTNEGAAPRPAHAKGIMTDEGAASRTVQVTGEVERTASNTSATLPPAGFSSPSGSGADRGGLGARLRHGSLSLRQKKSPFWKKDGPAPRVSEDAGHHAGERGPHLQLDGDEASTGLLAVDREDEHAAREDTFGSASPIVGHGSPALGGFGWKLSHSKSASAAVTGGGSGAGEGGEKEKRSHRFSIGRKRSAVFGA